MKDNGFYICPCCKFDHSIWLHLFNRNGKLEIHGMGYPDDCDPNYEEGKWNIDDSIRECEHDVIGAIELDYEIHIFNDIDKFINFIKKQYGTSV